MKPALSHSRWRRRDGKADASSGSGFLSDPIQDIRHFKDDFVALPRLARLVFRIGLEARAHPVGRSRKFSIALLSNDMPSVFEALFELLENIIKVLKRKLTQSVYKCWRIQENADKFVLDFA